MIIMVDVLSQEKAKKEIVDSVRDLYTAKITLPLGNPNLKLVHTNQFCFTELPTGVFDLDNFEEIARAFNSPYNRFGGYTLHRWYIEEVTITNNGGDGTMELTVNPFASDVVNYKDNRNEFMKAYTDATTQNTNTDAKKTTTSNKSKVKSVATKVKLKNVAGFSKSDQAYIKKIVTSALNHNGNPTKPYAIAKAIHEFYKKYHVYSGYTCMPKMRAHGFEKTWKIKGHNCGDGAAILQAMFRCAGLIADIFNGHNHFWIRLIIDGKYYYCDQAGAPGAHNTRVLGTKGSNANVWQGTSDGHKKNDYC